MVQTLNGTAICHIKILAQHEMAPNTFLQNTQYSFKNQCSMHGNDEKHNYFEVNLNLESLSNCNFLDEFFSSYFIYNFGKNLYKNKEKQKKIFKLCFMLTNH